MREFDLSAALRTDLAEEAVERFHEKNGKKTKFPVSFPAKPLKTASTSTFYRYRTKTAKRRPAKGSVPI